MAILAMYSCSDNDAPQPQPEPQGPLVITKADFASNYQVGGTTFSFFLVDNAAVSIPVAGEDQTWDFSTLTELDSNVNGGNLFQTPSNSAFPSATYTYGGQTTYNVSGVVSNLFDITYHIEISDAGAFDLGFSQDEPATISVPTLGATFSYPIQNRNYTGSTKNPTTIFPAQLGNPAVTTNGITDTSSFTVTAPAFGLDNTPAQTVVTTDTTHEIIASGTANLKGIGEKRVLVSKNTYTETINYFLGGAPAPPMLLSTLGVTDGASISGTTYRFIAEGLGTVGFVYVNEAGEIFSASFRKAL